MVLLGYFYGEAHDATTANGWSPSFNGHSSGMTKAVGTSALKSRSTSHKPTYTTATIAAATSPGRVTSSGWASYLGDISSSYTVANDGAIYEWVNGSSTPWSSTTTHAAPLNQKHTNTAASISSSASDNPSTTSPDRKSRGRSSSVWSSSTGLKAVRSRSSTQSNGTQNAAS